VLVTNLVDLREDGDDIVGSSILQEARCLGKLHASDAISLPAAMEPELDSAAALFAVVWKIHEHLVIQTMTLTKVVRFLRDDMELSMLLPVVGLVLEVFVCEPQELSCTISVLNITWLKSEASSFWSVLTLGWHLMLPIHDHLFDLGA
jgi:hypothetical protein